MLEITLAIYYFTRYKAEIALLLRYLLFALLLVDTVCLMSVLASAWQLLIQSFQTYTIKETEWTAPLTTYMVAVSAVAEELFLINRCRRLWVSVLVGYANRRANLLNRMQSVFVLGVLLAMVVTHVWLSFSEFWRLGNHDVSYWQAIMEFYSGGYVVAFATDDPNARRYGSKGAAIVASIAATVDIVIPIALIWQIHLVTPPHISKERSWRDTIVNVISSGGCGGIMTVILVVLFWVRPDIYYVLFNTMGHIYIITIFVNLLVSKRSPHEVPDDFQLRKFSFTANINLHTFSEQLDKYNARKY
ncbi:hypothetical protein CVT26_009648 [Gymnopilus dilepis]|uniref:Uncharacterized protein n=1 Tax=Gymnopilus dilepis TaxID=231916 RepID=A0A409VKK3_9AGAR|nr:hypothetical protein CVT26_009648 [Gymnopilus dilepis]